MIFDPAGSIVEILLAEIHSEIRIKRRRRDRCTKASVPSEIEEVYDLGHTALFSLMNSMNASSGMGFA